MRSHISLRGRALVRRWVGRVAIVAAWACCVPPVFADEPGSASVDRAGSQESAEPTSCARLSVLNGGAPRGDGSAASLSEKPGPFARTDLNDGVWLFVVDEDDRAAAEETVGAERFRLGALSDRARLVSGDFDGDGDAEFALFLDGDWFIDVNGNGQWDETDLFVRLGDRDDQPLVGDWDGDGKDDVGVFGRHNSADGKHTERATAGLPDADNNQPAEAQAVRPARPVRLLQQSARGDVRSDEVDYVLIFDGQSGVALAGDFNGDGVDTVAIFDNGRWFIDVDGDGRPSEADFAAEFGQAGALPFVADFDGDGIDEIGVFRAGVWFVDSNHNHRLDNDDLTFKLGAPGDRPAPADLRGQGKDVAATYRARAKEEKKAEPTKSESVQ